MLQERHGDPEEILSNLGFGERATDTTRQRLPSRFLLQPSAAKGISIRDYLQQNPALKEQLQASTLGWYTSSSLASLDEPNQSGNTSHRAQVHNMPITNMPELFAYLLHSNVPASFLASCYDMFEFPAQSSIKRTKCQHQHRRKWTQIDVLLSYLKQNNTPDYFLTPENLAQAIKALPKDLIKHLRQDGKSPAVRQGAYRKGSLQSRLLDHHLLEKDALPGTCGRADIMSTGSVQTENIIASPKRISDKEEFIDKVVEGHFGQDVSVPVLAKDQNDRNNNLDNGFHENATQSGFHGDCSQERLQPHDERGHPNGKLDKNKTERDLLSCQYIHYACQCDENSARLSSIPVEPYRSIAPALPLSTTSMAVKRNHKQYRHLGNQQVAMETKVDSLPGSWDYSDARGFSAQRVPQEKGSTRVTGNEVSDLQLAEASCEPVDSAGNSWNETIDFYIFDEEDGQQGLSSDCTDSAVISDTQLLEAVLGPNESLV